MKRERIAALLPDVLRRTDDEERPTRALLEAMAGLLAPAVAELDGVEANFDPRRAGDRFVGLLAQWVDVDRLLYDVDGTVLFRHRPLPTLPGGMGRLRELVAAAAELARWRGTARGLKRYLEIATGLTGFEIEDEVRDADGSVRPFLFRVAAPAGARTQARLVRRILELEKPAYAQCELRFKEEGDTES